MLNNLSYDNETVFVNLVMLMDHKTLMELHYISRRLC